MDNNTIKISIGVPIYNQQKYIAECATSLFNQTYHNIEYVFVNDCSTDSSMKILLEIIEEYPHLKKNIKIINHTANMGLWGSRNTCIENMEGDYLTFCDPDDWIEPVALAKMLDIALSNNADMVCLPYYENRLNKQTKILYKPNAVFDLNCNYNNVLYYNFWAKLIKKDILKDTDFRVYKNIDCWEDLCVLVRCATIANKIVIHNTPYYHYRKENQISISNQRHSEILEQHLECTDLLTQWFIQNNLADKYSYFINHLKFTAKIKMLRGANINIKRWKETYPETNKMIFSFHQIPLIYRILFKAVDLLPTWITQSTASIYNIFYTTK
ncbi:MAG: glycosyltransferase family 2 protein [Muribaculaceae bacterium]|nr:glycosyltransferase family 2 protein [Muribaculaceae bacterium]